ncbi:MAG: hypothetical protein WAV89_07480 [Ignavibacteriaceae bacterium]
MQKPNIIYILIILLLFFCGYYFFRLDDTFIFYKYAKNIAEGNGYVFNIGEKVNATTSPLYTLILALLYWIIKPIYINNFVVLGNLISISSILLILFSMKKIFDNDEYFYWFAAIFLAMPLLKLGFGMETFLNLALIVFSVYLYTNEKFLLASAFIALSVLARFDSILFAGIIFLYYIFDKRKFPSIKMILIFLLVVIPWFVFSKIYFNSFLPTTIGAKLSQNELGLFGGGLIFLTNSVRVLPGSYLTLLTIISTISLSLIYLYKKKINIFRNKGLLIILFWAFSLFFTYAFIIKAPPYQWYYTPFAIPISIILAITFSDLVKKSGLYKTIIALLFISACVLPVKNLIEGYNPKYLNFFYASKWLNNNAPDGSILAVDDIGILGYYYNKGKIVDALGLINPEVSVHLKQKDYDWFLNHYKPEFIVHEYPYLQAHLRGNENIFWQNYSVIKIYQSRGEKIAVYKKNN